MAVKDFDYRERENLKNYIKGSCSLQQTLLKNEPCNVETMVSTVINLGCSHH